jgi:hypothetical protein
MADANLIGKSADPFGPAVFGINSAPSGIGVLGIGSTAFLGGLGGGGSLSGGGVQGNLQDGNDATTRGLLGCKDPQFGQAAGVYGESRAQGVMGLTIQSGGTGVYGGGTTAAGGNQIGVRGETVTGVGVQGQSFGEGVAIQGQSLSGDKGLAGRFIGNVHVQGNPGTSSGDLRVEGTTSFGGLTTLDGGAKVNGDVEVTGDIRLTTGQDCAEEFDVLGAHDIDPGTVMVINEDGVLQQSDHEYDKKVAGVVSGAGDYRPGIVLGKREALSNRLPISLVGKVYCKVDARFAAVEVGDLLTTSPTPGHAMKADDPFKAFGAVIGKALRPLKTGQGLIPILIALQ